MDKDVIAFIVIIAVVVGGFLVYAEPWERKGPPRWPRAWQKNEELTSRLQDQMREADWTGIEIAVYEHISTSYPRTIRLYTKPVSPEGKWSIYDTGQVTKDGRILNLKRPWSQEE